MQRKKHLELYIHIPFCAKKCAYCDFLSFPVSREVQKEYVLRLIQEIRNNKEKYSSYVVDSIFFGGGTPSILQKEDTSAILQALWKNFDVLEDAEITTEANPGSVTEEKLIAYRKAGINRISFGLQSVVNEELRMLGRIHTYEDFLESYQMARRVGFTNINVDLISAIPGQTPGSWRRTLETVALLEPEHISAYSLIIEPGTPFFDMELCLPSEEEEREIYYDTEKILTKYEYQPYEISNYSKKGYECRHNIGYWTRKEYLGMGLGASSLIEEERFSNTNSLEEYLQGMTIEESSKEKLSIQAQMEEFMFLGLRMRNGVSKEEFRDSFLESMDTIYGKILKKFEAEKLIKISENRVFLTARGIDVSNSILSEFLL